MRTSLGEGTESRDNVLSVCNESEIIDFQTFNITVRRTALDTLDVSLPTNATIICIIIFYNNNNNQPYNFLFQSMYLSGQFHSTTVLTYETNELSTSVTAP